MDLLGHKIVLRIYPKKSKPLIQKRHMYPMSIAALFMTAKIWKQLNCPSLDKWIEKMQYIYTIKYFLAIKRNGIL